MTPEWQRLLDAVKVVCDGQLLLHRPGLDPRAPLRHADDCPGCELREAYEAVGEKPAPKKSMS